MVLKCVVCGSHRFRDGVHGVLSQCLDCRHVFYPGLAEVNPTQLYDEAYFTTKEYLAYPFQQPTLARNFVAYLRLMRRYGAADGRLLEVGCAYGFFLREARRTFEVEGIDVSREAVAAARQQLHLSVHCGSFTELPVERPFDVVCMWDTIEHLIKPDAYVIKARQVLRDGGYLFLTTGDIGSLLARLQGRRWRMIHPPTHLHYFSRVTLTRLLERSGFRVVGIKQLGIYRQMGSMLHMVSLFSKRATVRSLARFLAARIPAWLARAEIYLDLSDVVFVAARAVSLPHGVSEQPVP